MNISVANDEEKLMQFLEMDICVAYSEEKKLSIFRDEYWCCGRGRVWPVGAWAVCHSDPGFPSCFHIPFIISFYSPHIIFLS